MDINSILFCRGRTDSFFSLLYDDDGILTTPDCLLIFKEKAKQENNNLNITKVWKWSLLQYFGTLELPIDLRIIGNIRCNFSEIVPLPNDDSFPSPTVLQGTKLCQTSSWFISISVLDQLCWLTSSIVIKSRNSWVRLQCCKINFQTITVYMLTDIYMLPSTQIIKCVAPCLLITVFLFAILCLLDLLLIVFILYAWKLETFILTVKETKIK